MAEFEEFGIFSLPLICSQAMGFEDIELDFSHNYGRKRNENIDKKIEEIWKQRVKDQPNMFNGQKFRFASAENQGDGCILRLGLTDYKDFQGTNMDEENWQKTLKENGEDYLASPLGNGILLITTDKKIPILLRSNQCGECVNMYCLPGGHGEPTEVIGVELSSEEGEGGSKSNTGRVTYESLYKVKNNIKKEIFDSLLRETRDELGVPIESIGPLKMLGVTRRKENHRPVHFFRAESTLASDQILKMYLESEGEDAFESTKVVFLSADKSLREQCKENDFKFAECHDGGLQLYDHFLS